MRETELLREYLDQLLGLLGSPAGVAMLFLVGLIAVGSVSTPIGKWFCLFGALYAATLPLISGTNVQYVQLAFPLEQLRQYGRPITYGLMGMMMLPLVTSVRGWRMRLVHLPLLLFFLFQALISVRLAVLGNQGRGFLGLASFSLALLTFGIAVSRWMQTLEDFYTALWCISCTGATVALATCYQLVINRGPIISGNRLTGVTGNPQYLGIIIAYTMPVTCHLLTRPSGRKMVRPLLIAQAALMIVLLLWTGSRTGALSLLVGMVVLFYRRLGRLLIFGAIIFAVVLLALPYFEGSATTASRLLSNQNTRAYVWANMIEGFRNNMLFGASRDSVEVQESSYLASLAQFGLIGSLPFLAAVLAMFVQVFRLRRNRLRLGAERGLVDMITAVWAAIGVSAAFEGALLGTITFPILMVYLMSSVNSFVVDWVRADASYELQPQPDYLAAA